MAVFTAFFQMLALLIIIGTGYYVTKAGMLDEHTNNQMSQLIVNVFNPLLTFSAAANAVGTIPFDAMKAAGMIAVTMFAVFILAGMILTPLLEKDRGQQKIFQMMFVFSNVGFIGIPVVSSILGAEYVVYVTEFMLVYAVVFYTYGVTLMNGEFSFASFKEMINPGTVFSLAAMLVILFGIQLPDFIKTAVTYLGNVTSPMALIAVGFTLAHSDWKVIFGQPRLYVFSAIKLLALPLLMFPLLKLVTADKGLISTCMIMIGMPVGNMPLILGTQKGIDSTACGAAIILSTILCVFTIPILLAVI